jgi:5-methylcytosine-specific restriction protein A
MQPDHEKERMAGNWEGSTRNRKAELPRNWRAIREIVLARDEHRCVEKMRDDSRCPTQATEVDHFGAPWDHRPAVLRALCGWHHDRKSSADGQRARRAIKEKRKPEKQPGPWI